MRKTVGRIMARAGLGLACGLVLVLAGVPERASAAEGTTYVMKLSTSTLNDAQHEWMKMFVAAVEKDSGGRIKGEIYPASQLGSIPRQIEGTQFGSIQGLVQPPEFFVGLDERFEVLSVPGLFTSMKQAAHVISDPTIRSMVLGFGANKGLHGISLFMAGPAGVAMRKPVHHLAEFKGMKIRVLASESQEELIRRMDATPVAMTLADVLPAIQQGTIDGALATVPVLTALRYYDAARYFTEIGQPFVFSVAEISAKWYRSLPADLQKIIDGDGAKIGQAIVPWQLNFFESQRKVWVEKGGTLISLPPAEHATMMANIASIGEDISKSKPALNKAFKTLAEAVHRYK